MKRKLKVIGFGLILGILLIVLQKSLDIPKDDFKIVYIIVGVIIIVGIIVINVSYFMYYRKLLIKIAKIADKGDYNMAISQIETLQKKAKGGHLNNVIEIVRAGFYNDKGSSQQAIEILENMNVAKINKKLLNVYYMTLCTCYFSNNNSEKAVKIYDEHKEVFN